MIRESAGIETAFTLVAIARSESVRETELSLLLTMRGLDAREVPFCFFLGTLSFLLVESCVAGVDKCPTCRENTVVIFRVVYFVQTCVAFIYLFFSRGGVSADVEDELNVGSIWIIVGSDVSFKTARNGDRRYKFGRKGSPEAHILYSPCSDDQSLNRLLKLAKQMQ